MMGALRASALWFQLILKYNLEPMYDVSNVGLELEEDYLMKLKEMTRFVDELKTVDDLGKFHTAQPFWIHY